MGQSEIDFTSQQLKNANTLLPLLLKCHKIVQDRVDGKFSKDGGAGIDEVKALESTAENERLLIGLINLTGKILHNVDAETSAKIVEQQELVKQLF